VPNLVHGGLVMTHTEPSAEALKEFDCVLLVTHHRDFNYEVIANESPILIDTRNATRKHAGHGNIRFL